jgi:sirohydrochlorin cobaltochelatase
MQVVQRGKEFNSAHSVEGGQMRDKRLVLLTHGSKDPRWQLPFNELTNGLKERVGGDAVRLAFMEFAAPKLSDVAEEAVRDGKRGLLVLPLFLAAGAHLDEDIPAQIALRCCLRLASILV